MLNLMFEEPTEDCVKVTITYLSKFVFVALSW